GSLHARNAGSRCPFRTPDPLLEPQDGPVHLRPSQQDPHHQPGKVASDVPGRDEVRQAAVGQPRHHPDGGHQAPGPRDRLGRSQARRRALRRPALARRHADQLQDGQDLDQAPEGHEGPAGSRPGVHEQERAADVRPRDGKAREGHRRHPGHECPAGRHLRDRRGLPQDRRVRSQEAGHPAGGRGRLQPLARRHRLRDPRQRRLGQGR
ncbi:MAG: SSU ribosomal protein S2p (SAe), partial [uncultured Ramlibacter sp.]